MNHKRVARLLRDDNLLAVQLRAFVVTMDTDHDLEVSLSFAGRLTLTGMNQLRVTDIPYIRLMCEFVYLAVMLDAYSRKVVSWALERTLADRLPIAALRSISSQSGTCHLGGCIIPIVASSMPWARMYRPFNDTR